MKSRGIIFRSDMVRAIREGRKTQTRRLLKCDDAANADDVFFEERGGFWFPVVEVGDGVFHAQGDPIRCPYGVPGDELWVRETWAWADLRWSNVPIVYRADGDSQPCAEGRWRPSIFMPHEASRLTLVVRSVRVERLSAITDADAVAEGFKACDGCVECFITAFRQMHKLAADADPWLWVVGFERKASP